MNSLYAVVLLSIPVVLGAIAIIFCVNFEPKKEEDDNETSLFI